MPAKTVRFYHSIGLLAEPARDTSGYRRYSASDAIALLKVRALAQAGIPLHRSTPCSPPAQHRAPAIDQIECDLEQRITRLQDTRRRLRTLTDREPELPPPEWPPTWTCSDKSG